MPAKTGSKPVPEDSTDIKTKNTSNSVFYLNLRHIAGKGTEFTLIKCRKPAICSKKLYSVIVWALGDMTRLETPSIRTDLATNIQSQPRF